MAASRAWLISRHWPRSDDPEADSPDDAWPLAESPIHRVTGTFADSDHASAFRSTVFRLMFPLHVVALMLLVCVAVSVVLMLNTKDGLLLATPMTYLLWTSLLACGLGARIVLHLWKDEVKAQRLGAFAWTTIVAFGCTADCIAYVLSSKPACEIPSMPVYPLFASLFALINASHGMEFWHTALLVGLVLCDFIAVRTVCDDPPSVDLAIVTLLVTFGAGHFGQLLSRHAFLQTEHLQTSRERLEYDVQWHENRMHGSSAIARLPTIATPAESSAPTSTTSAARAAVIPLVVGPRAAIVGKGRAAPDARHEEAGEQSWDQPPEPGAAGLSGLPSPARTRPPSNPSIISSDDYEPSYRVSAACPNPAAMQLITPLFRQLPLPGGLPAAAQPPLWLDEEEAAARLARRWGAHMWGFVRLLFLGLAAPASVFRLLDWDSLRHIVYHVLLNSSIGRVAVESRLAPWAAVLSPVLTTPD